VPEKLLKQVQVGDIIVFDSVSRNAAEGIKLYMTLYDIGNEIADIYIEATNRVLRLLAT
jgi:hypothetical protein